MKRICLVVMVVVFTAAMLSGCSLLKAKPLSESIVGEWTGQVDVAQMLYKEIGDELGIDLSPEPAYCDMTMAFDANGTGMVWIDREGFAQAVGQCIEPYTTAFLDFDTSALVSMLMQYVAKDMGDSNTSEFTYFVDDETETVTISDPYEDTQIYRDGDGNLLLEDVEMGQTVVFRK